MNTTNWTSTDSDTVFMTKSGNGLHIVCDCHDTEHQLTMQIDDDPEWKYIYVHVHLTQWRSLPKRILHAVRYVFGYRSKYGDWDELIISENTAEQIRDYLNNFLEGKERR